METAGFVYALQHTGPIRLCTWKASFKTILTVASLSYMDTLDLKKKNRYPLVFIYVGHNVHQEPQRARRNCCIPAVIVVHPSWISL